MRKFSRLSHMEKLSVKSFGPIADADVSFGDLTVLVGPQASGKSLFFQLLKLLIDKYSIRKTLEQYNYIWGKEVNKFLELYFGEGMSQIWNKDTEIIFDNKVKKIDFLLPKQGRYEGKYLEEAEENLFYIPAQRILSVSDGRPKQFMEFDSSAPFVLRQFSETLRLLLQYGLETSKSIFPIDNQLKKPLRDQFNDSIFHNGKVVIDESTSIRKLKMNIDNMNIPFIAWSAGQKEFLPLLLGFYWLCPPSKVSKKDKYQYVVIEEPEMGLHPQAIKSVMLQVIDLMSRGYKVIISTHSPVILEFAWAFNTLKAAGLKDNTLFELFDIAKSAATNKLFKDILKNKTINTYYFSRRENRVISKNITSLDAASEDFDISDWGGLSEFSTRATDVVAKYVVE